KVTASKMKKMGIFNGADLKQRTESELSKYFGKSGKFFYNIVRGIDNRAVQPNRESKSVGAEDTFETDLSEKEDLYLELEKLAERVSKRLINKNLEGKTITLKVKFEDFTQITRSASLDFYTADENIIFDTAASLFEKVEQLKKIRLLGISISNFYTSKNFINTNGQLSLF
ncbi:DNA polymerase IV, partial [Pseudoxanthomonas sp. SGD-10]